MNTPTAKPSVGLFVTCLVDTMRPSIGFASVKLLEDAGCDVSVPPQQTCCSQPAFNAGDRKDATKIAKQVIETFEGFDYVVLPSGSCGGMIRKHYPELFEGDPAWFERAVSLSGRTYELTSFLSDVMGHKVDVQFNRAVTYHDSCSGLRELNVKEQPRALLQGVRGLSLSEGIEAETCCGFGGLFCVKYPDISGAMVDKKIEDIKDTGADVVLGGDLGCLLNIAGRIERRGDKQKVWHVAEVLAGMADDTGAIGHEGED